MYSRRRFLAGTASLTLSPALTRSLRALYAFPAPNGSGIVGITQKKKRTRIILLGTKGGPRVGESGRSYTSTLILINDVPYVVDCGYGTTRRCLAAALSLNEVR